MLAKKELSLNRTKIEWTDYTWNPVTGCKIGCSYCYARRIAQRFYGHFQPTFHEDRLNQPGKIQKPSKVFVCSMGELFGDWIPEDWTLKVLSIARECRRHIFQFLTKQPQNLSKFSFSENCWVGVTMDRNLQYRVKELKRAKARVHFVSAEPLLEAIDIDMDDLEWLVIGAQTNPNKQPEGEWVQTLIDEARKHNVPVFLKHNLIWHERIQEFPRISSSFLGKEGSP